MKAILILALIAVATSAHAKSRFDTLFEDWKTAGPAQMSDLNAAYTGRCFYPAATHYVGDVSKTVAGPDDAIGSLLVGDYSKSPEDDAGPEFKQPTYLFVMLISAPSETHKRFDDWSQSQAREQIYLRDRDYVPAYFDNKELYFGMSTDNGEALDVQVRKKGSTLYVAQTGSHSSSVLCYFYKKLN